MSGDCLFMSLELLKYFKYFGGKEAIRCRGIINNDFMHYWIEIKHCLFDKIMCIDCSYSDYCYEELEKDEYYKKYYISDVYYIDDCINKSEIEYFNSKESKNYFKQAYDRKPSKKQLEIFFNKFFSSYIYIDKYIYYQSEKLVFKNTNTNEYIYYQDEKLYFKNTNTRLYDDMGWTSGYTKFNVKRLGYMMESAIFYLKNSDDLNIYLEQYTLMKNDKFINKIKSYEKLLKK